MCEALRELMRDEIDKEVERAVEKAVSDAERNTQYEAIKNIMKKLTLSADEAMEILSIPEEDRTIYLAKLK